MISVRVVVRGLAMLGVTLHVWRLDYDRLACRNDGYDEQWLMAIKPAVTLSGTSTSM